MVITFTTCQTVRLCRMLSELKYEQKGSTKILCDNKFTIVLKKNLKFHGRNKYISIKFRYVRKLVKNNQINQKIK